jgi:succinate-semialdehyde dehydrogenase/glutarate-semialdehyde dehydrogenase
MSEEIAALAEHDVKLLIENNWVDASDRATYAIMNPATGESIGKAAKAGERDLALAVEAAGRAFPKWRETSPYDRSKLMRRAAELIRSRTRAIARAITLEQGKPLGEAMAEVNVACDTIEWFAEEGRRTYGRIVPSRDFRTQQAVIKEPVGPVALFTPWNFPLNQAARKIAAAMCAGCTIVAKPAEEAPSCVVELARAFVESGLPAGVLNLVFGSPAQISEYLIAHPAIRKISFTGSTAVGRKIASLAGHHMKRVTMELGGHAPVLVFDDVDVDAVATEMAQAKFRNAGQICVSPTRFVVQRSVYEPFVERFAQFASSITVGAGLDESTVMGPMANQRRVDAMEALVKDALDQGASLRAGGKRRGNRGYYFEPTVLTDVPLGARAMNEEPFGPLALIRPFDTIDEAIDEANRLPYGLASFAYSRSSATISKISSRVESGMISVNANLLALPEVPFGGVKDSGYGSEGGSEAVDAYMVTKLVKITNG